MSEESSRSTTSARRCVDQIRALILAGEFLPGQGLRQAQLAERLHTSRIPVREALGILEAEGVVLYQPHVGHTVTRLNEDQLNEIYTMRTLLETELVQTLDLDCIDLDLLADLAQRIEAASNHFDMLEITDLNLKFHFHIFDQSPCKLVRSEIYRLWNMSGFYRSAKLYDEPHRIRNNKEHQRIIHAIKNRDMDELLAAANEHRAWRGVGSPYTLKTLIAPSNNTDKS
ncbi:MAG: GntR family transcriptional regulator [Ferrimicrobium sp.]